MYWYFKIMSLNLIFFSILIAIQSQSFISLWIFLELSTMALLFFMMSDFTQTDMFQEVMKFFMIQALSGLMILIIGVSKEIENNFLLMFLLSMILIFKMGSAPFHLWVFNLSIKLSWSSLFMFLTFMKIIPLQMLSTLLYLNLSIYGFMSFFISSVLIFYCKNLKHILIISSMIFLGSIFFILKMSIVWMELLMLYLLMLAPLSIMFWMINQQKFFLNYTMSYTLTNLLLFIFLFSMSGIPPLPGFFIKYFWILNSNLEFFMVFMFLLVSLMSAYMYLGLWMNLFSWNSFLVNNKNYSYNFMNFNLMAVLMLNFILVYYMFNLNYIKQF